MNSEMNLFNPLDLDLSRSTFEMHPTVTGTCNAGRLIPARFFEVMPGDSVKVDVRSLFKMTTPVYPTMDQLYAEVVFYFVPNRLVLGDRYGNPSATDSAYSWAAIVGAQSNLVNIGPLGSLGNYMIPGVYYYAQTGFGTLADYMGLGGVVPNNGTPENSIFNALPFLSYFAIWNEDWRDESTTTPVTWSYGTSSGYPVINLTGSVPLYATSVECAQALRSSSLGSNYGWVNALSNSVAVPGASNLANNRSEYWLPFPTFRFHGYYGSCLPWPQRNTAGVELPLGSIAPIVTGTEDTDLAVNAASVGMTWANVGTGNHSGAHALGIDANNETILYSAGSGAGTHVVPTNLYADLSSATAANVNALRAAIQKQRWYEKLARSGNRYDELEYGLFGVRPHDSGLDRPLYLGGKRIPLSIEMVASTNGAQDSGGSTSLGNLGAFSHTNDKDSYFYHSFDDWGTLMCLFTIRHHDSLGTGIHKSFLRRTRDDLYFPTFAHLGEENLPKAFLISDVTDRSTFGYQQAWEEYRQAPDTVCGLLRPGKSLSFMTYAEGFSSITLAEYLNASTQVETVDKTLITKSYQATGGFQFVYQLTFDMVWRRPLPTYSIPGLMDHF